MILEGVHGTTPSEITPNVKTPSEVTPNVITPTVLRAIWPIILKCLLFIDVSSARLNKNQSVILKK